jgi:Family of unknown function (DUF6232)
MTVYYRGHDIVITHEVVRVSRPQPRCFRIRELHSVRVVQGAKRRRSPVSLWIGPIVVAAAAVALPAMGASSELMIVLMMLAAASVVGEACLREPIQPHLLVAVHRDEEVQLYDSVDTRTFGQVKRALQRAMERYGDR